MITDHEARYLTSSSADATSRWAASGMDLSDLVDAAESWVGREPTVAARLAELGRRLTDGRSIQGARLAHVGAQAATENGRLEEADRLLTEAAIGYQHCDEVASLARVGLGQAHLRALAGDLAGASLQLEDLLAICDGIADHSEAASLRAKAMLNLAALEDLRGRHQHAASRFAVAAQLAAELGDDHLRLQAFNNRAHSLALSGRTGESLAVARRIVEEVDASTQPLVFGQAHETIGRALVLAGHLGEAITSLELAQDLLGEVGAGDRLAEVQASLAEAYLAANLVDDAVHLLDRSISALGPGHGLRLARAVLCRGRAKAAMVSEGARDDLELAADLYSDIGDRSGQLAALVALAELDILLGNHGEARAQLDQARFHADPVSDPAGALLVELTAAQLDPAPALSLAAGLLALCDLPPLRAVLLTRQGQVALGENRVDDAIEHLSEAVDIFEQVRTSLIASRHRRSYLLARLEVFEDLVTAHLRRGGEIGIRAALDTVERSRARALLDLVHGSLVVTADDRDSLEAAAIQKLLADVGSSYDRLLGPDGGRGTGSLLEHSNQLEDEIADAMERTGPTRLEATGAPIDGVELGRTIRDLDATVVSYHWLGDRLEAFVIQSDDAGVDGMDVRRVDLGIHRREVGVIRHRIEAAWSRLRPTLGLEARWADALLRSGLAAVSVARAAVWEPLWRDSHAPHRVVVVPVSGIEALPFPAIVDDQIQPVELVVSPSISLWARSEQRPSPVSSGPGLVLGFAGVGLEHVEAEAQDVAREIGPDARLVVGVDATSEAIRQHGRPNILHMAAHGLFRQTNPMFSALRLSDSWMSATELMTLDLRGALVVLSACETGRADMLPDAEAFGFVRAALAAGARTFVGSHWLVNDRSTADLMRSLHQQLAAGLSPAAALAEAQREVRAIYPHPYHWSSFTVAGAGFSLPERPRSSETQGRPT